MRAAYWVGLYALALATACPNGPDPDDPSPTSDPENPPAPAFTCSHDNLNQAYLAGAERARQLVDDRRKVGIIPVKLTVDDCDVKLEVLDGCNLPGFYRYNPRAKTDSVLVSDEGQVFNQMPLGAENFVHRISGGQSVKVDNKIVGEFATPPSKKYSKVDLEGDRCIEATHYISKIFVGGFAAGTGKSGELRGNLFGSGSSNVFTQEGEASACKPDDSKKVRRYPHELCSVPVKIALSKFSKAKDPTAGKTDCKHDLCEAGDALDAKCNTCTEAVCQSASYCCKSHWDGGCIAKAKAICKNPCSSCEHDLCEQGKKLDPTCDPCAQKVCAKDSYCCKNKWDKSCVKKVVALCGKSCKGVSKTNLCTGGRKWNGSTCVCPAGKIWKNNLCRTPATCNHDVCVSGGPLKYSCNSCTQKVCNKDKYCCNNRWDSTCLKKVKSICKKTCPCDKYGTKGKCEGRVLKYCIGGKLRVRDCSKHSSLKYCGYNPKTKYARCQKTPMKPWGGIKPTCKGLGQPCTSNTQCCNKSCFGGKCQQPQ